ncbi:MAG TPA: cation:dicarboxylase symporter family transporter, partial [Aequorivita sp.]|nr:cation:dicarboxylase symporter family transporter [Aequorivita sp.]
MKKLALHWKIIIGLILGIIWALLSSKLGWSDFTINWIAPFGTIFINLLKLIAVPLVLVSIISGVANIGDPASLGRMGGKTLLAYLLTTLFAVGVGLILVNVIQPGKLIDEQSRIDNRISYEIWASNEGREIKDGVNYLQNPEFFERAKKISDISHEALKDASVSEKMETARQTLETTPLQPLIDIVPENFFFSLSDNGLMLQIIFFGIFFGVCLLLIPNEKSHPVTTFMDST